MAEGAPSDHDRPWWIGAAARPVSGNVCLRVVPCRRIVVEAAADELINLEVFPVQTQDVFSVMVEPFPFSIPPLQTRLAVRGGAAWIVRSTASSGTAMVTVVARRRHLSHVRFIPNRRPS